MKARRNAELVKAFTSSSTDELHHCRNEFEYVDRVALSTNRFYMIESLDLGSDLSRPELERLLYRPREALIERGSLLELREAASISFFNHCRSHLIGRQVLRAMYLIKAMGKVLDEGPPGDYVDVLDPDLAHAYEAMAYEQQLDDLQSDEFRRMLDLAHAEALEKGIVDYLGKDAEKLRAEADEGHDLLHRHEVRLLKAHDANAYSHFLAKMAIPAIATLVSLDENEFLSQFSFGIVSIFENLEPQVYLTESVETLKGKRMWHCPIPVLKGASPHIEDFLDVPTREINQATRTAPDEEVNLRASQFILENYINVSQESSTGWAHQVGLSQLWREAVASTCPCSYENVGVADCPCQKALYRQIRSFFLCNPSERRRICTKYNSLLQARLNRSISPWTGKIGVLSRNKHITRVSTDLTKLSGSPNET